MLSQERGTANLCFTASILGKIEEEGERETNLRHLKGERRRERIVLNLLSRVNPLYKQNHRTTSTFPHWSFSRKGKGTTTSFQGIERNRSADWESSSIPIIPFLFLLVDRFRP